MNEAAERILELAKLDQKSKASTELREFEARYGGTARGRFAVGRLLNQLGYRQGGPSAPSSFSTMRWAPGWGVSKQLAITAFEALDPEDAPAVPEQGLCPKIRPIAESSSDWAERWSAPGVTKRRTKVYGEFLGKPPRRPDRGRLRHAPRAPSRRFPHRG